MLYKLWYNTIYLMQGGPAPALVRARFPAKPLVSVSGREPRAGIFGKAGPAGKVKSGRSRRWAGSFLSSSCCFTIYIR